MRGRRKNSRFSDDDVRDIRSSVQPIWFLAEFYGVSKTSICRIRARTIYRYVR